MKHYATIFLAGVVSLLAAATQATPISITFGLTGAQETPAVVTSATGFATVTVDVALKRCGA